MGGGGQGSDPPPPLPPGKLQVAIGLVCTQPTEANGPLESNCFSFLGRSVWPSVICVNDLN